METSFLRYLVSAVLAIGISFGSLAEEAIQGYFRVQSAAGGQNDGYVEVRGPFTTAPDVTLQDAYTKAGTIMRLRAVPETHNGQLRYKIGNLSSQGIEVFGAPRTDYTEAFNEIIGALNTSDYVSTAYSMQRWARDAGYISTCRIMLESLFTVVAQRLDSEIASLPADVREQLNSGETLEAFARRFNEEVSQNIDLHAYLEPVGGNQYRLYFNWIDCTGVSEFYLANEQNRKSFELGFACMRQYMSGKPGLGSGEAIDANEAALWLSWGYDINAKYADCLNENGVYELTYEKIFADHELLYNWLKMYIERFLDPEKAPDAEILGINFKSFAAELQRHAIMQGFLKYIPSIQEGQKLYLTSGRFSDGVNEFSTVGTTSDGEKRFGLLGEAQALAAGDAAVWNVLPLNETDNYFAVAPVAHRENKPNTTDGHLLALYVDFPFEPVNPDMVKIMEMGESNPVQTANLENLGDISYVEIPTAVTKVPRRTPVLIECTSTRLKDNMMRVIYEAQEGDYDPATTPDRPEGFEVSDDEIDIQRSQRRAPAAGEAQTCGIMLATPVNQSVLKHLWNIDYDINRHSVYTLDTRESISEETRQPMLTPWFTAATTIPANHAFMLSESGQPQNAISLSEPADEYIVQTGIEGVETGSMQPDVLYDLSGRRAAEAVPGQVYILNGKKIIVR